jgi:hypothetical protein
MIAPDKWHRQILRDDRMRYSVLLISGVLFHRLWPDESEIVVTFDELAREARVSPNVAAKACQGLAVRGYVTLSPLRRPLRYRAPRYAPGWEHIPRTIRITAPTPARSYTGITINPELRA